MKIGERWEKTDYSCQTRKKNKGNVYLESEKLIWLNFEQIRRGYKLAPLVLWKRRKRRRVLTVDFGCI